MRGIDITDVANFGRVYTRSKETGSWDLLDSAYFSKLDLKIYSEDRIRLHPKFSSFLGKSFSVSFQIKNPDLLNNVEENYKGSFRVPIKLGENPAPDLEHFQEAFELEMEMFRELNLVSNERAEELIRETLMCAYWMFCLPGKPILEQHFIHTTIPMTVVDDSLEDYGKEFIATNSVEQDENEKIKFSYKTLSALASMVISGNFKSSGGVMEAIDQLYCGTNIPMSNILEFFGLGKKILNAVVALREAALETGKKHGISPDPFLKPFTKAVMAMCVELSNEWKTKDHTSMVSTITKIHQDSVFGIISCEAAALQFGIEVREKIRTNPLFEIYLSLIGTIYQKINDLISYARESQVEGQAGKASNEVYLLHKGKGWSLEKALKKIEDDANEAVEQLVNVGDLLLQMYPQKEDGDNDEHENLKGFIQTVKGVVTGYVQWYAFIDRYHPGMVYDCYIDVE